MNPTDLKRKLASLWKNTFHDSDEFISMLFDNYFNPELAEYEEVNGDVVSGLIGIPYNFGNADSNIKGLYLCGLATSPQFRSRGIMTKLLSRINEKAAALGFAFTFLIPADDDLRKFYYDRDYVNAFYRVVDNYTSLHDFNLDFESALFDNKEKVATLKRKYFASLSTSRLTPGCCDHDSVEGIKAMIRSVEDPQGDLQIIHTDKDIDIIIHDCLISGGEIHFVTNSSGAVTAVAFASVSDAVVSINKLFATDIASKYKVLDAVKKNWPDFAIRHFIPSIEMDQKSLWARTYGAFKNEPQQSGSASSISECVYSLAAHAKVYGMARILDLYEILKFQARYRSDLKYSILVKSSDVYTFDQITTRDGVVKVKKIPVDSVSLDQSLGVMPKRDICQILFRRRDTDNMITEAFGIPSINGAISLMLD